MPHTLLLATRNKGKIEEFRRILEAVAPGAINLVGLNQFPDLHDVIEDGATFEENALTDEFQKIVTEYAWGAVWSRPDFPRKTRSMLNLAMLTALNRPKELRLHMRAAIRNARGMPCIRLLRRLDRKADRAAIREARLLAIDRNAHAKRAGLGTPEHAPLVVHEPRLHAERAEHSVIELLRLFEVVCPDHHM